MGIASAHMRYLPRASTIEGEGPSLRYLSGPQGRSLVPAIVSNP